MTRTPGRLHSGHGSRSCDLLDALGRFDFTGDVGGDPAHRPDPPWSVTKLRPPEVREDTVVRPRLDSILDDARSAHQPLVLVSAPAGSGKSTVVASWAGQVDVPVVWFQVEEADNDPIRFWSALVAGLAAYDPAIGEMVDPLLRTPRLTFAESALPALVNTLDEGSPVVVVLDDYHLISSDHIHREVEALIDSLPGQVTVVVSTRFDPPFHLGRSRVRGHLREIRAEDLRFDAAEANAMLGGTGITPDEVETLCQRTEGWAAGLVLASVSLGRSPDPTAFVKNFAGDNRMVVDYLTSELWEGLPDSNREFFLSLSIPARICGPLVDALLDSDQGAIWLTRAARDNQLIIPLDDQGHWYRFHHLLRDLLRARLEQEAPQRVAELHRRSAGWLADHDDRGAAIDHALAAGDFDMAADLMGGHGSKVFSEGHLVTVQGWLDTLGQPTIGRYPSLAVLQVWTMIVDGDFARLDDALETARQLLQSGAGGAESAFWEGSLGAAAALGAIAKGDIEVALSTIEAIASNPQRYEVTTLVTGIVGICRTWRGHLDEAVAPLEEAAARGPQEGEHLIAATALMFLAVGACASDDQGRARHMAQRAIEHADAHHLSEYHQLALAHSVLGRTLAQVDGDEAIRLGRRGAALARRSNEPIMVAYALVQLARIHLDAGASGGTVDQLLTEARQLLDRCPDAGMVLTLLARAEARLARGAPTAGPLTTRPSYDLTERELTVLRLLPSELSVRGIASELYVSHNTVKGHIKAVYRKLGVNDRALAVQRAREMHLL